MFRETNEEKGFGIKKGGLFFSNSVEVLFEHLKVNLFPEGMGLFSERILIAPSQGMQNWIQMQLASSLSISCGFTTTFLNKGVDILREKLFCAQKEYTIPSQLDLFLRLLHEMEQVEQSEDPLWQPLNSYLQGKTGRKLVVAEHLTQLFIRYGIYGSHSLSEWEKKPANWQQALWGAVVRDWDYPQRVIGQLQPKLNSADLALHLFAFSHISPLYFYFFCRVSEQIPVYLYQFSPCQEFWSDLPPDHPSLLLNLGKVGREMAKLVEKSDTDAEDAYLIFGGNTQLRQVQRDLLTLQHSECVLEDDSLQIHLSTTPHQEIENLYQILQKTLIPGKIEPKDVIVMAPQIATYAPYIAAIFNDKIPYQIADMPIQSTPLAAGLFMLLNLEQKRWSAPAVLELIEHPLFQKKQGFTDDDLDQIKTWVKETGACWAIDAEHRNALLQKAHCQKSLFDEGSTWMDSFGRLIAELSLNVQPERIELSQAELLGDFVTLLRTLYSALKPLEGSRTLKEWASLLKTLVETYFAPSGEHEAVFAELDKIGRAGSFYAEKCYSFSVLHFLLKQYLAQESATINGNQCQAVRFCSMLPMRAIPAKIICMIGLNHDAFPRKDELNTLNLLKDSTCDYYPSRLDFDRYLFLEAILSARYQFIISYVGRDPYDLSELPPSSVVAEFQPLVAKNQIYVHSVHQTSKVTFKPFSPFTVQTIPSLTLPKGEIYIDVAELTRLVRSPLSHYLRARDLKILEEESVSAEEPFKLTPLKMSLLRNVALKQGVEAAIRKGEENAFFPVGALKKVAQLRLHEEFATLTQKELVAVDISPFAVQLSENLKVIFWGKIEGVHESCLCVPDKKSLKNAIKAWPKFLLLNTQKNSELCFAGSDDSVTPFFEEPHPFLRTLAEFYFMAEQQPLYFALDWIEPILKEDPVKLEEAPIYDAYLKWQLKGRTKVHYEAILAAYGPIVRKLYQEMADAWF